MKKMLALALITMAALTAGAAAVRPPVESAPAGEVDEALVNAKIDARLGQRLAQMLAERAHSRELRASR